MSLTMEGSETLSRGSVALASPRLDSSPAAILHWRISLQHDSLLLAPLLCLKMLK